MDFNQKSIKSQHNKKADKNIITEEEEDETEEEQEEEEKSEIFFSNVTVQTINPEKCEKTNMIGYSNFGKVYELTDNKNNIYSNFKVYPSYPLIIATKEFTSILELPSKIPHPFNVEFKRFGFTDYNDRPTMFHEYCLNRSLDKMIELKRKGKLNNILTNTQKQIILIGIAKGMMHLQKSNIIHRDLKPDNIILDDHLYPHIADFGLSKSINKEVEKFPIGTPRYMAPEVWNDREYSFKSDIFAFGMIIYELLARKNQINDGNNRNQISLIDLKSEISSNFDESISDSLKELIKRCLDEDANKRPSIEQIVKILTTDHSIFLDETDENARDLESINERYQSIIQQDEKEEEEKLNNQLECLNVKKIDLNLFEKESFIDSGGFGKVFSIRNKETGEVLVAKRMNKKYKSVFLHELRVLSEINHPFIVKLIGYSLEDFDENPCLMIVIEYMKNGSLENIIRYDCELLINEQWTDTMKLIHIYEIASVMKYLHSHDFLHCDLKPSNILINELGLPTICDFGLSLNLKLDETIHDGFRGTAAFCSPELFEFGISSKKSDVYSFSMVAYAILTDKHPFEQLNPYQICYQLKHNKSRPVIDISVPDRYKELIIKCWDENPDERPSFEQIVYELRTDESFITDKINKEIFQSFVSILDEIDQGKDVTDELNKLFQKFENIWNIPVDITTEIKTEFSNDYIFDISFEMFSSFNSEKSNLSTIISTK